MKNYYIGTVQIAVLADSEAEAQDSFIECLSDNLMHNGAILDWQYNSDTLNPAYIGQIDLETYKEGDAFKK